MASWLRSQVYAMPIPQIFFSKPDHVKYEIFYSWINMSCIPKLACEFAKTCL